MLQVFSPCLSALNFVSGDFIEQKCRHGGCFSISEGIEVKRNGQTLKYFNNSELEVGNKRIQDCLISESFVVFIVIVNSMLFSI